MILLIIKTLEYRVRGARSLMQIVFCDVVGYMCIHVYHVSLWNSIHPQQLLPLVIINSRFQVVLCISGTLRAMEIISTVWLLLRLQVLYTSMYLISWWVIVDNAHTVHSDKGLLSKCSTCLCPGVSSISPLHVCSSLNSQYCTVL